MKLLATLSFLLALAVPAPAGPKDWVKHHKRFLVMESAATGSALIGAYGLHHCRQGDVERCTGHYGAAWGIFGTGVGLNLAMTGAAEGCWKNEGGKFCNILAYSGSAAQFGWGIHQWTAKAAEAGK